MKITVDACKADPVFVELYDHKKDPAETVNVAGGNPKVVSRLLKQFKEGWKGSRPLVSR